MNILLWICLAAPQETAPPKPSGEQEATIAITRLQFSREREGQKVIAEGEIASTMGIDLRGVRFHLIFYDGRRQVRKSQVVEIEELLSDIATPLRIEVERVESFNNYKVIVESGEWSFGFTGTDLRKPPTPEKKPPPNLQVVFRDEIRPEAFPGDYVAKLAVQNSGPARAKDPTAALSFFDGKGRAVHTVRVRLEDFLEAGMEDAFDVVVPRCPEHARCDVALTCHRMEISCLHEELTDAKEVQVTRGRLARLWDNSVRMTGVIRNGLNTGVHNVKVTFQLAGLKHPVPIPGLMEAGASQDFMFYLPDCPPVEGYGFHVDYKEVPEPPAAPPEPAPSVRRTSSRKF